MNLYEDPTHNSINYCNICGWRSPFKEVNNRKHASCTICGSLERHRHLYVYLAALIPFLHGKRVLHFAPEAMLKDIILSSSVNFEYYDVDYTPGNATHVADIRNLSFADNFFDYILAIHVLEHIDDDAMAFKEMRRVLKPGGMALLMVPYLHQYQKGLCFRFGGTAMPHLLRKNPEETFEIAGIRDEQKCFELYGQADHLRIYSLLDFINRLKRHNFRVEVSYIENLPEVLRKDANIIDEIVFAYRD